MNPPLIKGGQGREPGKLWRDFAAFLVLAGVAVFAWGLALAWGWLL